jgi:hypothetical protein
MKVYVLLFLFLGFCSVAFSQDFSGQWKGEFTDKSTSSGSWGGDRCEYVLDLECKGSNVSGYSYTYFTDEGKRYYTICRLKGIVNKQSKYVEVTEVERTKTNVPANIRNCFQVHRLSYAKVADAENLQGSWAPAPNQSGNCGFGTTLLSRRALVSSFPNFKSSGSKNGPVKTIARVPPVQKSKPPVAQAKKPVIAQKVIVPKPEPVLPQNKKQNVVVDEQETRQLPQTANITPLKIEKRNNTVLKTLEVENATIKIDLYDNGEVDGDSISLYYNNKLLLSKKRLTEKAISLTIPVEGNGVNELVMYAENLGTIPPNTALMVVMDGTRRYEVRITSDLQKSGTIRFIHKPHAN